jgi:60S ribosome subunit biogenesis protein NIP7
MRPLTEDQIRLVFEKLARYMGKNLKLLVERPDDEYCFRLHKNRVYYGPVRLVRQATRVSKEALVCFGVCVGKFTHSGKFRVEVTFLDFLGNYALAKVWLKKSSEMSFLYGNHVVKGGVARLTEGTTKHQAVVVYNEDDIPLGFGVMARSAVECGLAGPEDLVVLNQADLGLYLREEAQLSAAAL